MITLIYGNNAQIVHPYITVPSFTIYYDAAIVAQMLRFPNVSYQNLWITNIHSHYSQWERGNKNLLKNEATAFIQRKDQPTTLALLNINMWFSPTDWKEEARCEEGIYQICHDIIISGRMLIVTLTTSKLLRKHQGLRILAASEWCVDDSIPTQLMEILTNV